MNWIILSADQESGEEKGERVMILSYAVYLLCFLFLLWGGRFAGFKDRFHEDFLSKDSTKSLSGIAALFIIFHHIAQEWPFYGVTGELSFFNDIGFLLVSIFFFTSGYGLTLNADRDPDYMRNFGRRRLPVVLVPFYVTNILFALNYIAVGKASARWERLPHRRSFSACWVLRS